MKPILDGPPEFILLILTTGMIAFYSGVLNKVINKRLKEPDSERLLKLGRWLLAAEIVLIVVASLVVIRILLHQHGTTYFTFDWLVVIGFAIAHAVLVGVFCVSYLVKDSRPWCYWEKPPAR